MLYAAGPRGHVKVLFHDENSLRVGEREEKKKNNDGGGGRRRVGLTLEELAGDAGEQEPK